VYDWALIFQPSLLNNLGLHQVTHLLVNIQFNQSICTSAHIRDIVYFMSMGVVHILNLPQPFIQNAESLP
jgi:hypothetical protein